MSLKERFLEQKRNGTGFTILLVLSIIIFSITFYPVIANIGTLNYDLTLAIINIILTLLIRLAVPLVLEKTGNSLAAHTVLLALFLPNYIRDIFYVSGNYNTIEFISFMAGILMSIYAILKIYAHSSEIKTYFSKPSQPIIIILLISLIRIYLDSGFNTLAVYLILFAVILMSSNQMETLPLALSIYGVSLVNNLTRLFLNVQAPFSTYLSIIFSIVINILLILYIIRVYRAYKDQTFYN